MVGTTSCLESFQSDIQYSLAIESVIAASAANRVELSRQVPGNWPLHNCTFHPGSPGCIGDLQHVCSQSWAQSKPTLLRCVALVIGIIMPSRGHFTVLMGSKGHGLAVVIGQLLERGDVGGGK